MFLANTGTSKSIAWKDVKGKGDRWAITVRVCVVRWANLWQNDSLVSLELWHHTKITPKLCPSGFPTQTPDFPTTHWILMTDYICKCWQTIYCNGLSYCNVTKKPSLSPMFSSPFVSGSLEYTFWKYLPIYLAAQGFGCCTQDLHGGMWTLSCGMWNLVPWPWIEPQPPVLGAWRLCHWTSREVLGVYIFNYHHSHFPWWVIFFQHQPYNCHQVCTHPFGMDTDIRRNKIYHLITH